MVKRFREAFLTELISALKQSYPKLRDHYKVEWPGKQNNLWPQADILIDTPKRQFIVEYDEDSDPVGNLVKYWPVLDSDKKVPLTIIEVWKRGPTVGQGRAQLAEWIGGRLMRFYASFLNYKFIERKEESAGSIANRVIQIIGETS